MLLTGTSYNSPWKTLSYPRYLIHYDAEHSVAVYSVYTLHWTEAPSFSLIIAGAGSAPQVVVLSPLCCTLGVPLVVVLEGQSTGHAMCISQQSVYFCR